MDLGISAADIDSVGIVRDRPVNERAEPDELRACITKQVQVVFIVKAEGLVIGDSDANFSYILSLRAARSDFF